MDPEPLTSIQTIYPVFGLILLNALFVAAEYALISCDPAVVKQRSNDKSGTSGAGEWLIDHSELCVASIQLAITACSILVGWFGMQYFEPRVLTFITGWSSSLNQIFEQLPYLSFGITFVFLVFLHVLFGELVVKAVATSFPEATLSLLAGVVKIFTLISYPISRLIYSSGNLLLKPFRLTVGQNDRDLLSIKELKRLFSSVPSTTSIGSEQAMMIKGVVGFSETVAREVMTPRTDLTTINVDSSLDEVVKVIIESGFSRLPVRGEKVDDVLGVLLARDVIPFLATADYKATKPFDVRRIMRQAYFIPGSKPIDHLLNELKRRKMHMAVILDEHGGLDGVVTMEDLIEEIIGDIYDEGDDIEKDIVVSDTGEITIDGGVLVADLNDRFSLTIPEGEYDTIAGFIFTCLGRMPKRGDEIYVDFDDQNHVFINDKIVPIKSGTLEDDCKSSSAEIEKGTRILVDKVQGHRIETIKLAIIAKKDERQNETDVIESKVGESQLVDIASEE